jgi:hypothetical protein
MINLTLTEEEADTILAALMRDVLDSAPAGGIEYEKVSVTYHTVSGMVSQQRRNKANV